MANGDLFAILAAVPWPIRADSVRWRAVEIERNREVPFDELGYQSVVAATFVSDAMSYMVCVFTRGRVGYVAQISEACSDTFRGNQWQL